MKFLGKFIEPNKKERKYVNCKLCPKVLKYSGNTSNMRFHLESSHKAEFKVLQQSDKQRDTNNAENKTQQSVKDILQRTTPLLKESPRWNHLHNQCAILSQKICSQLTQSMIKDFEQ